MIKRLLALLLLFAVPAVADEQRTFARALDLNQPSVAATTNYIVTVVNLTNTTFTLAHQPDVPRNVTIAVTDTTPSITAGTITVTGLDVNGAALTQTLDLSSALTQTGTVLFSSITSVVSAGAVTLGGGGDETIIVGVGSVVAYTYCVSDNLSSPDKILTVSSSTTVSAAAAGTAPFAGLAAGDAIIVNLAGVFTRRTISTWTSNRSVVVNSAINLSGNSTTGYPFSYQKRTCGYTDESGWINSDGMTTKLLSIQVDTMTATGGLDYSIECRGTGDWSEPDRLVTGNIASARVIGDPSTYFIPVGLPETCGSVRVGVKFATVDVTGTDSISIYHRAGTR